MSMADLKKMTSETFHSDRGPMDQDEIYKSNDSSYELRAESPAQIGKKRNTMRVYTSVSKRIVLLPI